jgi:hypothetical protein
MKYCLYSFDGGLYFAERIVDDDFRDLWAYGGNSELSYRHTIYPNNKFAFQMYFDDYQSIDDIRALHIELFI